MDKRQKDELLGLTGNRVRFDCPMDQYTTFRVGGKAEALYETNDIEDLRQVITYLWEEGIPYMAVGRGSNLLVKDEGIEGLVIRFCGSLAEVEQEQADDLTILAGAGLPIADLLTYCRKSGLGGLEFLAGIPGTIGGAVVMNAGAFGKEIGDRVLAIHMITRQGDLVVKDRSEILFSYRKLRIERGNVVIQVCLQLEVEPEEIVAGRIGDNLKRRKETQPLEYPSAGSIFMNPPNDYAARLIEKVGLKGEKIGGAMISEKHANFIVNTGGAKASDVLALMHLAQEKVKEQTGIELQPEIQVVGG
jgi:UDP-N-acetylmuramate dehydrogenase